MLVFPNFTQLDLTASQEVFHRMPDTEVVLVSETLEPAISDSGLRITPDKRFEEVPSCDILFAPGGPGINEAILNKKLIQFVREQGEKARYVTSVCTGSLILGAAGLLTGYHATTHWQSLDFLTAFGAIPVSERFVIDGNRITGGGITAGFDFALRIVFELFGERQAKKIQLALEYNPQPQFPLAGSPKTAEPEIVESLLQESKAFFEKRRFAVEQSAKNMRKDN